MSTLKRGINISRSAMSTVSRIVQTFQKNGYECYLVGGSVRDMLLGYPVYDFDFATNAHPDIVMNLFHRVVPTGIKHGTVSILIKGKTYEVTTYRADGKYIDGRRPESVVFSKTLEEDVKRRDFTINGLAYDVVKGEIIDLVDGLEDIERGIIRTIGDPVERFNEDGLRSLRACRLAAKLNFEIEEETLSAIGKTLSVAGLVSPERVRDEIIKLLEAERPSVGFEFMRESGLMEVFLPELYNCYGVPQNRYHLYDIYYHSIYSCDAAPAGDTILRLATLFHDIGKVVTRTEGDDGEATFYNHEVVGSRITKGLMRRLKFSNDDISRVNTLIINHMFHYRDEWTDGAVRRFMRKVGLENLRDLFSLRIADRKGSGMRNGLPEPIRALKKRIEKVIEDENALKIRDLDINGHIIMDEFNLKQGPIIGRILNGLLELVLDNPEMNSREVLLEKAREIFNRIQNES
jgi:tRNA nucleotidyltransferase (CCA-adding enzyme)